MKTPRRNDSRKARERKRTSADRLWLSASTEELGVSDVLDGLAQVRATFMRAKMKPPTVMLLESHEEGMRFLSAIRQSGAWTAVVGSPELGRVVEMADGSAWMECKVMGIAVRWPANRIATPDGGWSYA